MQLDYWIDPACPFCWLTSRWVIDVAPHRDLEVVWHPISLLVKNDTQPDSPFYERVAHTHGLLRVLESVREAEGNEAVGRLYTVFGEHIHHQKGDLVSAAKALAEAGLDGRHAAAFDDVGRDVAIKASMEEAFSLAGTDVGTPILGFVNDAGKRVGFFGPVINRRLPLDQALQLWDGLMLTAGIDGFFELKRTRSGDLDFTEPE